MESHFTGGGRLGRLVVATAMTVTVAVSLVACSTSGGGAKHPVAARSAQPSAAAPATSAPAATASGLSGTWSGQYSGAYHGTFVLKWHQSGSRLSGKIRLSDPAATLPIHGAVNGGAIRFGTVGSLGITYAGTVSGTSMSGTYQVHAANGAVGGPWSATKSS